MPPPAANDHELIIVSGLSGSGKTTGLRTLEDLGYYCIDNLPIALLSALGEQLQQDNPNLHRAAVCIDIRNSSNLQQFGELIEELRGKNVSCQVLFFTASESALINRFNETRRKHPLTSSQHSTADAIAIERDMLLPISELADRTLDTSQDTIYDLRERILG
ncbi:MAG: RNase adaptor protein RapZ, partial [Gammaproteobacteria bacterium]